MKVCTTEGNTCLENHLLDYKDDLTDRKSCDCLNDCEMVHFFSTMQREAYHDFAHDSMSHTWLDVSDGKVRGILANYLVDPKNVFSSALAKNITKLANNLAEDYELARKRFDEVKKLL